MSIELDDIELKLLTGLPIEIIATGDLYSPLVKDIIELGYSKYNELLSCVLVDKANLVKKVQDDDVSTFTIILSLCVHDPTYEQKFLKAIELMFKEKAQFGHTEDEAFFYFGDITEGRYITSKNIEYIQAMIRLANQVKHQDEEEENYNPADEQTRKVIEEMLARRKNKPKPKPTINLHSIISGLACKSNSINHFNVGQLSLYQLYDSFHRLDVIENYHYTLVGIYSGNVDSKKINFNKIHWTKIIDKN
ncbi:hypothetical protein ACFQZE_07370 [Paenibacillus sp. GCM10027627]|uniref:hypothetical protein n=1 Tax=unclassified Paenibacillus TaxID=185978 RepID=UPI00362CB13A